MVGVGTLPLLLAMMISYLQGTKSLENVIGASFQALATETATKIDFIIKEEIKKNIRLASHPTLILTVRERFRRTSQFNIQVKIKIEPSFFIVEVHFML